MVKNLTIKVGRATLAMTQKDLVKAVEVTRQTMNAIEKSDYSSSIKRCIAICKVLNKTLDEVFWMDKIIAFVGMCNYLICIALMIETFIT